MKREMGREGTGVQPQIANAHASPVLDEATFQQILQAAYVIQEQNDRRREVRPKLDPAGTLAIIAETQELLHSQHYDVNAAARLIAERLEKITNAAGVALAVIEDDQLTYCAALGNFASLAGSSGPIGAGISEFLREGAVAPDGFRAELLERNDDSPAFFPVYSGGRIAGLLQLSFPESESIQEHEIRSCQVMAGLMGETISRTAELEWKQSLAAERATMLEALERLRPQLERLAAEPTSTAAEPAAARSNGTATNSTPEPATTPRIPAQPEAAEVAAKALSSEPGRADVTGEMRPSSTCGNCGFHFSDGELFCGRCGTPRAVGVPTPLELPFDLGAEEASQPGESQPATAVEAPHETSLPDVISQMPVSAVAAQPGTPFAGNPPAIEGSAALAIERQPTEVEDAPEEPKANLALVAEPGQVAAPSPWSSAVKTRKWLASLQQTESQWLVKHSGDVSIAVAALVLLLVLAGWNTHPAPKKLVRGNAPAQPSLTLFERMLVGLGLAEAPPTPVYSGNPNAQVWEDLHTGLYYCAGSELYGKTPGGKLSSQRDAQLDQFEPAARRTCE
ncbi:MAG TPA: hypothetical protein VEF05_12890 [Terriglobales bacterium]|nr:hypothetical protein [Terriglobales bacterium]